VFTGADGGRLGDFRKAWEGACATAGVRGVVFHDLRRSGARNAVRAGVPEQVVMEFGGWRTRAMLARYNVTYRPGDEQSVVGMLHWPLEVEARPLAAGRAAAPEAVPPSCPSPLPLTCDGVAGAEDRTPHGLASDRDAAGGFKGPSRKRRKQGLGVL
jgi:hypothetical protein